MIIEKSRFFSSRQKSLVCIGSSLCIRLNHTKLITCQSTAGQFYYECYETFHFETSNFNELQWVSVVMKLLVLYNDLSFKHYAMINSSHAFSQEERDGYDNVP